MSSSQPLVVESGRVGRPWSASLTVLVAILMPLLLPDRISLGPTWLLPLVQAVLLAPLVVANPVELRRDHPALRTVSLVLASSVLLVNLAYLVRLLVAIGSGEHLAASELVRAGAVVLVTDVVGVAMLLWDLDRGGPFARDPRHAREEQVPDLLFPQMTLTPEDAAAWNPTFVDYLFTAFTAATAFSPTDTMPLTARAKVLFMVGSGTALLTIAGVAARAVNLV